MGSQEKSSTFFHNTVKKSWPISRHWPFLPDPGKRIENLLKVSQPETGHPFLPGDAPVFENWGIPRQLLQNPGTKFFDAYRVIHRPLRLILPSFRKVLIHAGKSLRWLPSPLESFSFSSPQKRPKNADIYAYRPIGGTGKMGRPLLLSFLFALSFNGCATTNEKRPRRGQESPGLFLLRELNFEGLTPETENFGE